MLYFEEELRLMHIMSGIYVSMLEHVIEESKYLQGEEYTNGLLDGLTYSRLAYEDNEVIDKVMGIVPDNNNTGKYIRDTLEYFRGQKKQ